LGRYIRTREEAGVGGRRVGGLLIAVVLALVGCGGAGPAAGPGPGSGAATPTSTGPLLAFTATTLDGKPFDGRSLSGRPAVLWFWAPWCPVCLQQAPGVRTAVERYADRVGIVGVAGLDKTDAMPEFVRLAKVAAMTHLADEAGVVWKRFGVTSQSIFVLLDADGTVTFQGRLDADEIPDRIGALLA
jgi:thiol-disulfide isomerase/thioredoxin